jgi:hypothetical protein
VLAHRLGGTDISDFAERPLWNAAEKENGRLGQVAAG